MQINPRPVLIIKDALWVDNWMDGMGWDRMVTIGHESSKSTFGANNMWYLKRYKMK